MALFFEHEEHEKCEACGGELMVPHIIDFRKREMTIAIPPQIKRWRMGDPIRVSFSEAIADHADEETTSE